MEQHSLLKSPLIVQVLKALSKDRIDNALWIYDAIKKICKVDYNEYSS